MDKKTLRKIMLKRLDRHKEVDRLKKSDIIKRKLFALTEVKKAKKILFFASFRGEVDTYKMIEQAIKKGKAVCLPCLAKDKKRLIPRLIKKLKNSLEIGPLGIPQPKPDCSRVIAKKDLDCIVVPGLAFEPSGLRLGRGLGCYDRFLANIANKTRTIGVCFDFQVVSCLPSCSKDLAVQKLISA
jgi:5-formyltetrahydrofolate cyclo-ligase